IKDKAYIYIVCTKLTELNLKILDVSSTRSDKFSTSQKMKVLVLMLCLALAYGVLAQLPVVGDVSLESASSGESIETEDFDLKRDAPWKREKRQRRDCHYFVNVCTLQPPEAVPEHHRSRPDIASEPEPSSLGCAAMIFSCVHIVRPSWFDDNHFVIHGAESFALGLYVS
ncbi:hypothetical protein Bpfe_000677, partial [Biomphalaria pfeifferi]